MGRAAHLRAAPLRLGPRRGLGRTAPVGPGRTARLRGRPQRRRRRPRTQSEPAPHSAGRAPLRVLLGRPRADRPYRSRADQRNPGPRSSRHRQTLRRQRLRVRQAPRRRPRLRTGPARGLPRALRSSGGSRCLAGHGRLQRRRRHDDDGAPPLVRTAQGRMGLRRSRRLGLGRRPYHRGAGPGGPRPGDAGASGALGHRPRPSRGRRPCPSGGHRRQGTATPPARGPRRRVRGAPSPPSGAAERPAAAAACGRGGDGAGAQRGHPASRRRRPLDGRGHR